MAAGEKVVEGGRKIRNICERNREIIFKGIFKPFSLYPLLRKRIKKGKEIDIFYLQRSSRCSILRIFKFSHFVIEKREF